MKIKFKKQAYQTLAVESVADCFAGQPDSPSIQYRIDPGADDSFDLAFEFDDLAGFKNADVVLPRDQLLKNIRSVQSQQGLPRSSSLVSTNVCTINLDIEMETGTGKTYCYIKTMFELNKRYGWAKFIVVVPSIAIREGVYKSFEMTAEHFLEDYGKRARFFIYNSKQLHNLESFSSDAGINVMIINVQAFNARGKDARRIYEELDDFQSRKPIDVIKSNRPILILDEPQKMEGKKTVESLAEFNPLMLLRYSATHKTEHNRIHRLDALDAYNQKLVKKIAVRGISVKGLTGTNAFLYVAGIQVSATKPPTAMVELEIKTNSGIKRVHRNLGRNDNLYDLSNGLDQYNGFILADIDAIKDTVSFTNGVELRSGEAIGDVNELALRRIQIKEAIRAHFEKEQRLFRKGVKVLTLFFIDEVAKYRQYNDEGEQPGEYAKIFEEEYQKQLAENLTLFGEEYDNYLNTIDPTKTHNGYFSIDKKTKRLVDPKTIARGESAGETDDVDAYDLILKDKERLLSFDEPVRFIFSHSALREGWDNPNVFVICTLKHSDNTISRRQEVGRGMRISVNQDGHRMDDPATVHENNVLTVVTNESYRDFVSALQRDISQSLSTRPKIADKAYFKGKVIMTEDGDDVVVTDQMASQIHRYLVSNDYTDDSDAISTAYHDAHENGTVAPLPPELEPYKEQVFTLINDVFSEADLPDINDDRRSKENPLSNNFQKKEFQALWNKINRKAASTVQFDTNELIAKCVSTLDTDLKVTQLQYTVQKGQQKTDTDYDELTRGEAFEIKETKTDKLRSSIHSSVKYDLIGKLAEESKLTRRTIAKILQGISVGTFKLYRTNPEDFIAKSARLINEQKATVIVEHLVYNPLNDTHSSDVFTREKQRDDFSRAVKTNRHVYDYVVWDSKIEREFVKELDTSTEVVVYAKLPRSFFIPTPVGNYNPDWAIAFEEGEVKHVYFIAETKGSLSSLELRRIEQCKIECAQKFFSKITSDQVRYDVVNDYEQLMDLVR